MRNIFDYSHVKSVSAIALIDMKTKDCAGKIVANWSHSPNGSVCTAQVIVYDLEKRGLTPLREEVELIGEKTTLPRILIGKAGGYGHDKLSTAIVNAIRKNVDTVEHINFDGVGKEAVRTWFENKLGITFIEVI